MKITALTLPSPDPSGLSRFYAHFGFRVRTVDNGPPLIEIGHTRVTIIAGPPPSGSHHLALTIPSAVLTSAREHLAAQAAIRVHQGADQFHFEPPFGPADSVYADDPDGLLLELIARDRPHRGHGFIATRDVLGVGEVAVPVESVPAAVDQLRRDRGLSAVLSGPEFAAVGDHDGMLILTTPDRIWFPTDDRRPELTPLAVQIEPAGRPVIFSFGTTVI